MSFKKESNTFANFHFPVFLNVQKEEAAGSVAKFPLIFFPI